MNPITENTTIDITLVPGAEYRWDVSGDFGGSGTVKLAQVLDDGSAERERDIEGTELSQKDSVVFVSPGNKARIKSSGGPVSVYHNLTRLK